MQKDFSLQCRKSPKKDDIFLAVMTDIFKETSQIIAFGKYQSEIATEFGSKLVDNSFEAPNVLSRKKQVIPTVTNALRKVLYN